MATRLTVELLQQEAISFARAELTRPEPSLFGVTDGKAVGRYLEHIFQACLRSRYEYAKGSSAKGIDACLDFLECLTFTNSKRPITVESLQRLNIHALAEEAGPAAQWSAARNPDAQYSQHPIFLQSELVTERHQQGLRKKT